MVRCGALCNNAVFGTDGNVTADSNPTEAAMVKFSSGHVLAENEEHTIPKFREIHSKLHEIPFNSKNKWQVSVHRLPKDQLLSCERKMDDVDVGDYDAVALVQMKGAPERILNLCDRYFYDGDVLDLDEDRRQAILEGNAALGRRGERVLALAVCIEIMK